MPPPSMRPSRSSAATSPRRCAGPFDLVVSNPPYVPASDLPGLQREVRDHEPQVALLGGPSGVELYLRLIPQAARLLRPGGCLIFEIGYRSERRRPPRLRRALARGHPRFRPRRPPARPLRALRSRVSLSCAPSSTSTWTPSSSRSKNCSTPRSRASPWWWAGAPMSAAWSRPPSYAARKFGVHSAMPLRTAAKLCPQAIFVDGHPERYREYSHKVHAVLTAFSPKVEMASDRRSLPRPHRHGAAARAAAQGRQRAARRVKRATGLNCSIGIATSKLGCQDLVRSGQAERHPVGAARARSGVPGAARRAQDSRRRQGDGAEAA